MLVVVVVVGELTLEVIVAVLVDDEPAEVTPGALVLTLETVEELVGPGDPGDPPGVVGELGVDPALGLDGAVTTDVAAAVTARQTPPKLEIPCPAAVPPRVSPLKR